MRKHLGQCQHGGDGEERGVPHPHHGLGKPEERDQPGDARPPGPDARQRRGVDQTKKQDQESRRAPENKRCMFLISRATTGDLMISSQTSGRRRP